MIYCIKSPDGECYDENQVTSLAPCVSCMTYYCVCFGFICGKFKLTKTSGFSVLGGELAISLIPAGLKLSHSCFYCSQSEGDDSPGSD